ncbi:MAG: cadmium-translocating P-type ATPase [Bdellovibrionales bacterium]|nr:cadmium-translocating P-type ATPase [Bdellovibrionales bacterium]
MKIAPSTSASVATLSNTADSKTLRDRAQVVIATLAVVGIVVHLVLRLAEVSSQLQSAPLVLVLLLGGLPLVGELAVKLFRREFGSDLLAGISIVTSVLLDEYLAGSLVVLMLSGGEALEVYAIGSASSVLDALARRMPTSAHRIRDGQLEDISLNEVAVGDMLTILPHETSPVDGTVVEGRGSMDESYLTGEPYVISKVPGSSVLSGAVNGQSVLTVRTEKLPVDSRYAKIMAVMKASEQQRPRLRRLGDTLGAWYTPFALLVAGTAWAYSGEAIRFLAVLVVATPCPLLIAIPVAIIGSVSLAAKRGIIIKDPSVLEQAPTCRIAIFDKTGTLTYGQPQLTDSFVDAAFSEEEVLACAASIEQYSKHPLAPAVLAAAKARGIALRETSAVSERPGEGLTGTVGAHVVSITSRKAVAALGISAALPPTAGGLECVILIDSRYAATYRFRDEPRSDGRSFIKHLKPRHGFNRVLLLSGDRESEVRYLAEKIGITEIHAGQTPEQKLALVRTLTASDRTLFMGDGINDAPALTAATVGIAFGQAHDVTAEAAGAVVLDSSLERVDELLHISARMRRIALQSAMGGIALSIVGMFIAAAGSLPPVAGAVAQELIDVFAVLNALRVAWVPKHLSDIE